MMEDKLKKLLNYYIIAVICAGILITGAVLSANYRKSLTDTATKLQQVKNNMLRIKTDLMNMRTAAALVKSDAPAGLQSSLAEYKILLTLDDVSAKMNVSEVNVSTFTKNNQEVHLPVALKGSFTNYAGFLNHLNFLQSLNGPFFIVEGVSISGGKGGTAYEIKGIIKMIATQKDGKG